MNIAKLINILDTVQQAELRKPFLETALAIEIGYAFGLPSAKVDCVITHFEQFHADIAKRIIGEVNEMYPFSVNVTYNMVVDVYKNRYTVCHEPRLLSVQDIIAQLQRPAFQASVDDVHAKVLENGMGAVLRSELADYIRRFVV